MDENVDNADRNDIAGLQQSMYETLYRFTDDIGGLSRFMFESAAQEQLTQPSWNTGVDYRAFFENGNESQKRAVRRLYEQADLDLGTDEMEHAISQRSSDAEFIEAGRLALSDQVSQWLECSERSPSVGPYTVVEPSDQATLHPGEQPGAQQHSVHQ